MTKSQRTERTYPIRAVSRMTGISTDALRAWERRYGAVSPDRANRGRAYSDADIARLTHLAELVRLGHAIGTIAGLSDEQLAQLLKQTATHGPERAGPAVVAPLQVVTSALERYDVAGIEAVLNRHAAVLPPRDLVFHVVLPLLRELGRRWEAGKLRPSQEHLVSASVRSVLGGLLRAIARTDATPRVVFATLSGERHELGLLSAALLTASAGYGVVYLGADLPERDVAHAASVTGARVVMVSATTPHAATRTAARHLARLLDSAELWVGGPQAAAVIEAAGERARQVETIEQVLEMLSRHAH